LPAWRAEVPEVARAVLQSLVIREEQGCPVTQATPEQDPVQPRLLAGGQAKLSE